MIEKIRGLSIKGRCFKEEAKFKFYPNAGEKDNDRITVVYGKNGSGKTTISEGFFGIANDTVIEDISADLLDSQDNIISNYNKDGIFVFNERYIDENVKIDNDGLETIILLGNQVDIQSEIDRYIELEIKAKEKKNAIQSEYEKYTDSSNPLCPDYHWQRIKDILKQPDGWAVKDAIIKCRKINSQVKDETIRDIIKLATTDSAIQLQEKFNKTKLLLDKISDVSVNYPQPIKLVNYTEQEEITVCNLLAKTIEKPVLSEREQLILNTIENGRQVTVENAKKDFSSSETKVCPYCYRDVDENYKRSLVESINRVLNKEVDEHKEELKKISFPSFLVEYENFSKLDSELVRRILNQITECNDLIEEYKKAIQLKIENIYTPINIDSLRLEKAIAKLNIMLTQLESKRSEFNLAVKKKNDLINELVLINKQMAYLQIVQVYKDYEKQLQIKDKLVTEVKNNDIEHKKILEHLNLLQQKKANIGLAINNINNALDYVFFAHGRLSIELKNEKYYLKSNGQAVKPKNISLGERNIIALCYFFTQIMANQEISQIYKNEMFVVIDDPVSSFDFENKVGIISFIRYQISRIINGNANSKILILSHDLVTIFDLNKAMGEICQSTKGSAHMAATTCYFAELSNGVLNKFTKRRSEYSELLKIIYNYAAGEINENVVYIGNIMRRALEAFSTFIYRKSIEDVSGDSKVVKALGKYSTYFENLMYRLVLHGESHYEEQVYNLHDGVNFYQFVSDGEKQRTAKDVLCFMYILNPYHIQSYLNSSKEIRDIEMWINKIPLNYDFEMVEHKNKRIIPLYDLSLSAGKGNEIFDDKIDSVEYETDNLVCDFALKILGNSMEPDIPNGSVVLIKQCVTLAEGKVGAFYYNGEVFCKKLYYNKGNTYLISTNPDFKPIKVLDADAINLYGEVVAVDIVE